MDENSAGLLIVLVDLNFPWWAEQAAIVYQRTSTTNQQQQQQLQQQQQQQDHARRSAPVANVNNKPTTFETALQHFLTVSPESPDCQGILVAIWNNICAFLNAYLAARSSNQVAVIGCYGSQSQFLFCPDFDQQHAISSSSDAGNNMQHITISPGMLGSSSKPESFSFMNIYIRESLKRLSNSLTKEVIESSLQTSMAGALGKALCYARRISQQQSQSSIKHSTGAGTTYNLSAINTGSGGARVKRSTRILAISCGQETQNQYLHFINAVFTAQKMGVVIDALVLDTENDSIMLQQAADLTHGIYHRISQLRDTGSVLFAAFLVEPSIRNDVYVFRRFTPIDYRAACFCHHNLINTGYVCSVCLSVFCTFRPVCSTCRVHFNVWKNLKASQVSPNRRLSSLENTNNDGGAAAAAVPNGTTATAAATGKANGTKRVKR